MGEERIKPTDILLPEEDERVQRDIAKWAALTHTVRISYTQSADQVARFLMDRYSPSLSSQRSPEGVVDGS